MRLSWLLVCGATCAGLAACSVYGSNLVGTGGAGGAGSGGAAPAVSTSSTSAGGTGGAMACADATACAGMDTDCQKRACVGGLCQLGYTAAGTALMTQKSGDCQRLVCDGQGNTTSQEDDADLPDDKNDCTVDTCAAGVPVFTDKPKSSACASSGGTLCTASGKCVACLSSSDCPSGICNAMNVCVAAQCNDHVKNGAETDVDCGGGTCPPCGPGLVCAVDGDCVSMMCVGNACAGNCTDLVKDGQETDVDCGGTCPACASGKKCGADADCQSGNCVAGTCLDVLVLSQVQTRGDAGGNDEFVEIYNPTGVPVTFSATWVVKARSALGTLATCANSGLGQRFAGAGQVIPPHGHLLYVNNTVPPYNGPTPGDGTYSTGIPDAASVVLLYGNTIVDALCFYFDAATQTTITTCAAAYTCEGAPIKNSHNNTSATNADTSLERKPGGAMGNTVDTDVNANDFATAMPADPHNLMSAPVP